MHTVIERAPGDPLRLMVIVGSVRPGRAGLPVSLWVHDRVSEVGGFEIDFVDLAELGLPFMNEPNDPKLGRYSYRHTHAWSRRVQEADAFVFVSPEYNHSYSPALKNAIDYLFHEWSRKPVGFVSYGGVSGGTRGVAALLPVLHGLGIVPTAATVDVPFVRRQIDDGFFLPTDQQSAALDSMLIELKELDESLVVVRREALVAR
jgi:NAD(P)H-dependent FMN reductase